ncbi:uncharacterized protein LY89DRAFT_271076 [Mollisia scopiformis]|uniref:Uncharacterized protein n=1 Tax=Mollisia scopiformis TaxID=149040 RepID=A0A132BCJ2_MOLSC|nr:uncharacterized protein LY89DRAFT_271076 [Mollisia scopiformis]KUJ10152.1 hypothetical protein LY89DRAFT_271076 [Mollisia scopiformis]
MMVVHPWQESDIVTLLSWLDFCIAHDVNFWESIIPKLQESRLIDTNQDFSFTRRQIQNKLIGLCRQKMSLRFDSRSHPKLSDVVSRGSACIPGLTQDMLTKVKNAVFHLEKKYRQGAYRTGIGKNEHDRGSIVEKQGSESSLSRLPKTSNTRLARIRLPTLHGSQAQNLPSPSKTTQESRALTNGHGFHDTGLGGDYMSLRIIGQESQAARISTLEEKNQRLAEEIQLLHNARNDREAASHDLRESDFYTFYRDGWDMKQRLASMQRTINFHEKLVPLWKDSMSYGDIDEEMGMIEAELQSISHCLGTASLRRDITVATGGLLESLIQSAFRVGSVMKTASEIWREILSLSDSLTALNTLVLVAIRDWILNTLFPVFEDGSLLSALFKSWRTVLLDCAGASLAHSLEATAYSQFIDSNAFKDHLIPEQAAILADRFIEASFPIFPLSFAFTTAYHFKASTVLMNSRRFPIRLWVGLRPSA